MNVVNKENKSKLNEKKTSANLKAIKDIREKLLNEFYNDMKTTADRIKSRYTLNLLLKMLTCLFIDTLVKTYFCVFF